MCRQALLGKAHSSNASTVVILVQRLEVSKTGINGWYCSSYGLYNDILTIQCNYCSEVRDSKLAAISANIRLKRAGTMSQVERELHADFFTQWGDEARLEIADMTDEQLTDWRNNIARIALEAKVKATVGDEVLRQRKAKKLQEGKPWLVPSEIDRTIKEVRQGKTRLSRTEKLAELMNGLIGVKGSEEIINKIKTTTSDSKVIKMISEDKKVKIDDSPINFDDLKLED